MHHGDGVHLLVVRAYESGNGVRISGSVGVKVVRAVLVYHLLARAGLSVGINAVERNRQRGCQIESRTQRRTPCRVGIDTGIVHAHVGYIDTQIKFVEEIALFCGVDKIIVGIAAYGEAVVVGLSVVSAHNTIL